MIIQAGLADGHDLGMGGQLAQGGADVRRGAAGVGGMPADGGEDGRKPFGDGHGAPAAFQVGADGNDFGDSGRLGAGDDLGQVGREIREIEVRVGVVKNGRHLSGAK